MLVSALAILVIVSLATERSGIIGKGLASIFLALFGRGAWVISPLLFAVAVILVRGRIGKINHVILGLALLFGAVLAGLARPIEGVYLDSEIASRSGGYVGALFATIFEFLFGVGKWVPIWAMGGVGFVLIVDVPILNLLSGLRDKTSGALKGLDREEPPKANPTVTDENRMMPLRKGVAVAEVPESEPSVPTKKPSLALMRTVTNEPKPAEKLIELQDEAPVPKEGYQLPPIQLLAEALLQPKRVQSEMQKNIETLEGTLEQFGIDATVVEVANGPTVTRYEIQLGPGVRVNRITALADNIAMELAASQVRVEAPIPGKAAIGVEVPNATPMTVTLRELAEDPVFRNHPSRLCVSLGKDVSGANKYADLTKMPHLLIGGATNSGKSIGLATLITSLLMRNTPKDVRLVMIDPKRVELTLFDHVPHLMCPVIKDVKEAAGVLRAVWREMDRRYDLYSEHGVRNIDGWNAKASFQDKMPYIVVIVDELADLMIQCGAEVETIIVRLAQLARAVGIHLVIATQRPSVDVITGLIKANIPSRIAFSVASYIDSRTILDQKGAEALIGRGDMLFKPIDAIKPIRVQGCYVSEKEIEAVCGFWRAQEKPAYVLNPVEEAIADPGREAGDFGEETDPLWEEAVRWVVDRGQASTSMLQRKFSIGFQRASRLLDMMEERAVVGPRDGPRPRDVLVNPIEVDAVFGKSSRYDVGRTIGDGLDE